MTNDHYNKFEEKLYEAKVTKNIRLLSDLHKFLFKNKSLENWDAMYKRYRIISDEVIKSMRLGSN